MTAIRLLRDDAEGTLVGTGPSLSGPASFDGPVLCLNESILLVPGIALVWDADPAVRLQTLLAGQSVPCYAVREVWEDSRCPWVRRHPASRYLERKDPAVALARVGTATVGIALLSDMGIRRIRLVGFDAFWRYEPKLRARPTDGPDRIDRSDPAFSTSRSLSSRLEEVGGPGDRGGVDRYWRISRCMVQTADRLGVELVKPEETT